jgi:hypothetical protein
MKKLFTLLIAVSICFTTFAQAWLADVGIPQEFAVFEEYQITSKSTFTVQENERVTFVKGKATYTYTYTPVEKIEKFGAYPLNLFYTYVHDGMYTGSSSGVFSFHKGDFTATTTVGPFTGQTYYYGYSDVTAAPIGNGYDITLTFYPYMTAEKNGMPSVTPWKDIQRKTSSGSWTERGTHSVKMTKAQIESKMGVTESQFATQNRVVFHCVKVNPNTHITSIFGKITKSGNDYLNTSLINGKDWHTQQSKGLITSFNQALSALMFSWVYYNDCEIPTVHTDTDWTGNFGQCFRSMYSATDPRCEKITITNGNAFSINPDGSLTSDQNQADELLQLVVHRTPMPEKNTEQEGYFDIKSGQQAFDLN